MLCLFSIVRLGTVMPRCGVSSVQRAMAARAGIGRNKPRGKKENALAPAAQAHERLHGGGCVVASWLTTHGKTIAMHRALDRHAIGRCCFYMSENVLVDVRCVSAYRRNFIATAYSSENSPLSCLAW